MQWVSAIELESPLLEFQRLFIRELHRKKQCAIDMSNAGHQERLSLVWDKSGLEADKGRKWRLLGFKTEFPKRELQRGGMLALDNLVWFVQQEQDRYAQVAEFVSCVRQILNSF
jgi:engulfment/cell motility protein 1